ncbi:unnamed protein product [Adineta ricciae]|uniref:Uncharacterized protein n=1 Tax=Adineta ricciae TaxID=249248 RepID=A0A815SLL9_ADIRI|nr:unnamed protein product [Adineta ricciae]CAF1590191.1 unnamed protein product [Adineta ricciae]
MSLFACARPKTNDSKSARNTQLEKRIRESSKENIELNSLNITDDDVSYIVNKIIKKNKRCQSLSLTNNEITSNGIQILINSLVKNSKITHLNLSSNPLGDQAIEFINQLIASNRTLYHLSLADTNITDIGFRELIQALSSNSSSLRTLDLRSNKSITDASIPFLIQMVDRNQTLSACRLDNCQLTEQGLNQLKEEKSVKW